MAKASKVETSIRIGEEDVDISATYWPGSPQYFDRAWGNWLPGDPGDVQDIRLTGEDGREIDFNALDRSTQSRVEDAIADRAESDEIAHAEEMAERAYDNAREDWER